MQEGTGELMPTLSLKVRENVFVSQVAHVIGHSHYRIIWCEYTDTCEFGSASSTQEL